MDVAIARWRLRNQHLTAPHAGSAAEVVDSLLAVQAENPSQSAWAVAARTDSPDPADLAGLIESGEVVRTHVLRPTWHYVARADIDWLLALTSPRIDPAIDTQLRGELTDRDLDQLTAAVLDLLTATPDRTRDEVAEVVRDRLPAKAEQITGHLVMVLMAHLELDRLVSSGRPRDGEHTYATYRDRVGTRVDPDDFDREDALARLALRYFTSHGPATVKDLAYWATLTITDVRRGLAAVEDQLASFDHDGRTFWHAPGDTARRTRPAGRSPPAAARRDVPRLPGLPLGPGRRGVVPRQRETAIGIALVDGQLVAGMKRTLDPSRVRFDLTPHRPLSAAERRALEDAAARYGEFLGRPAEIVGS